MFGGLEVWKFGGLEVWKVGRRAGAPRTPRSATAQGSVFDYGVARANGEAT